MTPFRRSVDRRHNRGIIKAHSRFALWERHTAGVRGGSGAVNRGKDIAMSFAWLRKLCTELCTDLSALNGISVH